MEGVLYFIYFVFVVWLIWKLFVWVGDMAERRGQDRFLWQVAAVFINPIGAMLLLWIFCRVKNDQSEQ
jgi:hypothetical protein